jgi:hypothetical protein
MSRGFGGSGQEVSQITAVPNLFVTATGTTTATIEWASAPTLSGKPTRTGYTYVVRNLNNGTSASPVTVTSAGITKATLNLTGLTSEKMYEISVVLNYSGSLKSSATTVTFSTEAVPPTPPNPVSNVSHTNDYYSKTRITWTNPTGDFDSISLQLEGLNQADETLYTFNASVTNGDAFYDVDNLTPNTKLTASITAVKGDLTSIGVVLPAFSLPIVDAVAVTFFPNPNSSVIYITHSSTMPLQGTDFYRFGLSVNNYDPNQVTPPNLFEYTQDNLPSEISWTGLSQNTLYYVYVNKWIMYNDRETNAPALFRGLDTKESESTLT